MNLLKRTLFSAIASFNLILISEGLSVQAKLAQSFTPMNLQLAQAKSAKASEFLLNQLPLGIAQVDIV